MKFPVSSPCSSSMIEVPNPGDERQPHVQGELTAWYIERGQRVAAGQPLYQITWPGIAVDYAAEMDGVLTKQYVRLRQLLGPGDILGEISAV